MFSELEEKAFKVIDEFLLELQSSPKGDSFITYGKPSEFFYAKELMNTHKLITYRIPSSPTSICDISPMGLEVFKKGGMKNYLISVNQSKEEKENLELQQLRTNVGVLTNQHMDYLRDRKRFVRNEWGMWLSLLLAVIAIIISLAK
jgi:hypothetical protein